MKKTGEVLCQPYTHDDAHDDDVDGHPEFALLECSKHTNEVFGH